MDFPPFVRMRSCGSAPESRLETIIITIFNLTNIVNNIIIRMRSCGSALDSRLEAITGDISVPGFGLDEQDLK